MSFWKLQNDGTLLEAKNAVYSPKYTIKIGEKYKDLPDGWQEHETEADAREAFNLPSINMIELMEENGVAEEKEIQKIIKIIQIVDKNAVLKEEIFKKEKFLKQEIEK